MLKLERTSHDHDVSVTFRNKEHFFTRPFLTAFGVALAIHLGLILLFQISPLKIRWNNTSSLPIIVETDLARPGENLVVANISPDALPDNILLKAPPPLPFLASYPLFLHNRQIEYIEESPAGVNLFNEIEKEIYLPTFSPAGSSSLKPISVLISGPLASRALINNPLTKDYRTNVLSELIVQIPKHLLYSVLVDEQSGRIFWHEPLQQTDNAALEKFVTSIIYGLQFAPTPSAFVTAGKIELHLRTGSL